METDSGQVVEHVVDVVVVFQLPQHLHHILDLRIVELHEAFDTTDVRTTIFTYDGNRNLQSEEIVGVYGGVTEFFYDAAQNLTS